MRYPFTSFTIAFFICLTLPFLFFFSFKNKPKLIPATVEIDAIFIEESAKPPQKENKQTSENEILETKIVEKEEGEKKAVRRENNKSTASSTNKTFKKSEKNNHQQKKQKSEEKLLVLYGPLPKIPEHLKNEAFQTYAMARFYIAKDGSAKVELIKPCSNPELNYLLLKNLVKWKFEASNQESVQDIKVNFKVENN